MAELALFVLVLCIVAIVLGHATNWVRRKNGSAFPGTISPATPHLTSERGAHHVDPASVHNSFTRVTQQPINKVVLHVSPDGSITTEEIREKKRRLRSEKVVGALTHHRLHFFNGPVNLWTHCKICLEDGQSVFSIAEDSAGVLHRRCCFRCLRRLGGQDQLQHAIEESERAADVWRYMQALDQLRSEFPDPTRRPWGEEMLFDAIAFRDLGARGERIVEKILNRRWNDRDIARIEGRPDPGPSESWTKNFSGRGTMELPDGTRIPVSYKISHTREYRNKRLCQSWISGYVWNPKEKPLEEKYLGKEFVLEMPGKRKNKRISLQITRWDGMICHVPGINEGFSGLTE